MLLNCYSFSWTHPLALYEITLFFHSLSSILLFKCGGKKEKNNALQLCAWLICRINETTCFSKKPPEKCPKFVVVVFACLTETCASWLRLFVFNQRGCWGWGEGVSGSLLIFFQCRFAPSMLSHTASVGSHFYQPLHFSVSFWHTLSSGDDLTPIREVPFVCKHTDRQMHKHQNSNGNIIWCEYKHHEHKRSCKGMSFSSSNDFKVIHLSYVRHFFTTFSKLQSFAPEKLSFYAAALKVWGRVGLINAGNIPWRTDTWKSWNQAFKRLSYWLNCFPKCFSSLGLYRENAGWCEAGCRWHGWPPQRETGKRRWERQRETDTYPWQCFLFMEGVLGFDGRLSGAVGEECTTCIKNFKKHESD